MEMNSLDNFVKSNVKSINQVNDAIKNYLKIESFSDLYICLNKDPLPVVTVSLRGGKKYRSTLVDVITFQWDIWATNSMIKRKHTKPYECKMQSNKVEYSIFSGLYWKTYGVKVIFPYNNYLEEILYHTNFMLITIKLNLKLDMTWS